MKNPFSFSLFEFEVSDDGVHFAIGEIAAGVRCGALLCFEVEHQGGITYWSADLLWLSFFTFIS